MTYQNNGLYNPGIPMDIHQGNGINQQQIITPQPTYMQNRAPAPSNDNYVTPEVVMDTKKGGLFTVVKDESQANGIPIPVDPPETTKRRGRPKKKEETGIVPAKTTGEVVAADTDTPTSYTYMETTGMLRDTLGQIDALNGELVMEFENVKQSRTMKNKYNVLVGLSENIGSLIGNRISVIKEINNSITKSNDLDYKKLKDIKAAQASVSDDKYIADVYQAMISNQNNLAPETNMPNVDPNIFGSGIVRANITDQMLANQSPGVPMDLGYLNYLSNLTPEQNLMRYENNPNVKQVVIYDAATNNKFFQMMDMSTMEVIPNVPVYDQTIMEDTTIDVNNMIAKNINLNETFPVVMINNDVSSQY